MAIVPRRWSWQTLQNLKYLIMGFLSNRQPEGSATSLNQLRPQYESVRQFQSTSKTKSFCEKIAFFPRRGTWQTLQNPKNLIKGFHSNRQSEEYETSPNQLRPQYETVRRFHNKNKENSI